MLQTEDILAPLNTKGHNSFNESMANTSFTTKQSITLSLCPLAHWYYNKQRDMLFATQSTPIYLNKPNTQSCEGGHNLFVNRRTIFTKKQHHFQRCTNYQTCNVFGKRSRTSCTLYCRKRVCIYPFDPRGNESPTTNNTYVNR